MSAALERRVAEAVKPGMTNSLAEQWAAGAAQDDGEHFGDVTEYGIWTGKLDLDPGASEHEAAWLERSLAAIWSPWIIVQEDSHGFIYVGHFDTAEARDAVYDQLEALYSEWCDSDGDDS